MAYEMRISDWSSDVCSSDLNLHAVVAELAAEKRAVDQWRVGEVPGVRVHVILVADVGEEAAELHGQTGRQRERVDVGLFDADVGVAVTIILDRDRGPAVELIVDVGFERQLGFTDRKAFRRVDRKSVG